MPNWQSISFIRILFYAQLHSSFCLIQVQWLKDNQNWTNEWILVNWDNYYWIINWFIYDSFRTKVGLADTSTFEYESFQRKKIEDKLSFSKIIMHTKIFNFAKESLFVYFFSETHKWFVFKNVPLPLSLSTVHIYSRHKMWNWRRNRAVLNVALEIHFTLMRSFFQIHFVVRIYYVLVLIQVNLILDSILMNKIRNKTYDNAIFLIFFCNSDFKRMQLWNMENVVLNWNWGPFLLFTFESKGIKNFSIFSEQMIFFFASHLLFWATRNCSSDFFLKNSLV